MSPIPKSADERISSAWFVVIGPRTGTRHDRLLRANSHAHGSLLAAQRMQMQSCWSRSSAVCGAPLRSR
jgi:hypothetical protein